LYFDVNVGCNEQSRWLKCRSSARQWLRAGCQVLADSLFI
jgi:hypothetical protein